MSDELPRVFEVAGVIFWLFYALVLPVVGGAWFLVVLCLAFFEWLAG